MTKFLPLYPDWMSRHPSTGNRLPRASSSKRFSFLTSKLPTRQTFTDHVYWPLALLSHINLHQMKQGIRSKHYLSKSVPIVAWLRLKDSLMVCTNVPYTVWLKRSFQNWLFSSYPRMESASWCVLKMASVLNSSFLIIYSLASTQVKSFCV